jgi:hypothetical protein
MYRGQGGIETNEVCIKAREVEVREDWRGL